MANYIPKEVVAEAIIANGNKQFTVLFEKRDGLMREMLAQRRTESRADLTKIRDGNPIILMDVSLQQFRAFKPDLVVKLEFDGYTITAT